ncbi:MAG: LytTR family DNA-binding domain-containing protein [Bacteroidota bacterium]
MRLLIIEDEVRAASQLQKRLQEVAFSYELLGIIDTIVDAVYWFQNNDAPDLVFMDIQLADGISFEIFDKATVNAPIIFTTAFDEYAIQAFKVNSIDYLLKPIKKTDLEMSLDKFSKIKRQTVSSQQVEELLRSLQSPPKRVSILAKEGKGFVQLPISELLYAYTEDTVTFGITAQKRYIIDEGIDELFRTLDSYDFFKINRGQIVAKRAIEKMHPYFNHRLLLTLSHSRGLQFIVSRPKTPDFKIWMNT